MKNPILSKLTKRELEILQLVGGGHSSAEIAAMTNLTHNTVCTHRKNILKKTGAKNIIAVVILAVKHKVIQIDTM